MATPRLSRRVVVLAIIAGVALAGMFTCSALAGVAVGRITAPGGQSVAGAPQASPVAWRECQESTGRFTLRYPDTWELVINDAGVVAFDVPPSGSAAFWAPIPTCGEWEGADSAAILDCQVQSLRDTLSPGDVFTLRERRVWQEGGRRGYLVEANTTTTVDGAPLQVSEAWLSVPLAPDACLSASIGQRGASDVSAGDWAAFVEAVKSVRLAGQE